ncbi:MAG: 50S ribosomal protein L6 [Verrucomicrobiales bacterium]|nr:50S ribosomal protein L6 [Verrucomicrobiales bacterium]
MSRVGNKPVELPEKVTLNVADDGSLTIEGPLGKLEWQLPDGIKLDQTDMTLVVTRENESRKIKAMHGTARSLVANMVEGVSKGFQRKLEIHGVGFRAAVKGNVLDLSLGFSHPVEHPIPEGVSVKVEENTKILVEGFDKQKVGQFAADVRSYYPPEPYKGKGVRYADEYVRRKAGKSVQ